MRAFNSKFILFITFFTLIFSNSINALEVLGYLYRSDSVIHLVNDNLIEQSTSLKQHIQQINILAPQAYQINSKGKFWGNVDPHLLDLAKQHHVKVMPLVTNLYFNSVMIHHFLNDKTAQKRAISAMVNACKKNHYAGLQIDFEHILITDKEAFTYFYQTLANVLHKNRFLISVAILPRTTDASPATPSVQHCLMHWNGAYDYTTLGKASDFVTIMAYDQHGSGSNPGSACDPDWAKHIIVYALKYIPASKISLGIPVHSSYWYSYIHDDKKRVAETDLTYQQMQYELKRFNAPLVWDKTKNVPSAKFVNDDELNNYLFPQNAATFKILFNLVKKYHLRGISLWCLGYEDPAIWKIIAGHFKEKF